jgi:hypothetical protein
MNKVLVVLILICMFASLADAQLKVIGQGDAMRLDAEKFPAEMKKNYEILLSKCTTCHSLKIIIQAVRTGQGPLSREPFNKKSAREFVTSMMRQTGADINNQDAKAVINLMNYLLDENAL